MTFTAMEYISRSALEYATPAMHIFALIIFTIVFMQETIYFYVRVHEKIKAFFSRSDTPSAIKANDTPSGNFPFHLVIS